MMLNNREKDAFWLMRAIAIISVICAHCNLYRVDAITGFEASVLSNVGTVGVGVFFFLSGYFFKPFQKKGLHKIIRSLIIPWLLAATAVWLYIVLRKGDMNLLSWIRFVIGATSIYYFMTDLLIIQGISSVLYLWGDFLYSPFFYLICVMLNIIALLTIGKFEALGISPYLNPFVFISYFALGLFISRRKEKSGLGTTAKNILFYFLAIVSLLSLLLVRGITYFWGVWEIALETLFIVALYLAVKQCSIVNPKMVQIGRNSFAIYLWHIPIAGIISNIFNRSIYFEWGGFIWPAVILVITLVLLDVLEIIFKKLKIDSYLFIFGFRG